MAEEMPSLHIDTDWKKQAQEEKRKLAEAEAAKKLAPSPASGVALPGASASASQSAGMAGASPSTGSPRGARQLPPPGFSTLVQSLMTQTLYYLGELAGPGGEPTLNLDMAKHQIDTLAVLEDKTKGNLTPEEQKLLDATMYETRMRFVSVASQMI